MKDNTESKSAAWPSFPAVRRRLARLALAMPLAAALACGGKPAAGPGGPGGPGGGGGISVRVEPVREADLHDASEYLATLKSRHSLTVQPQIDGEVTRIFVKSGDRVAAGAALLQIDPLKQAATVKSQEATRAMKQSALEYARQQEKRARALYSQGIVSKQDLDAAVAAREQAEADLKALGAQVEEQQVQLRYYRVTAPAAGVVGDIPVRVGDRVTTTTVLTTISEGGALEAYVSIPLEHAKDLQIGLPVEIVDDGGALLARTAVSFVSPQVDDQTQSVLVKAPVQNAGSALREAQLVRARVIWSSHRGPVIPVLAVTRVSGQYFAFVAEANGKGGLVARQRPVRLGDLVGDDYVVLGGLRPGEQVVVSGVQKLADGAPLAPTAPTAPQTPSS
ncbi:MAG TPA: efflux RND transporter periplasmic adaptor subunit [Thermoanaerobaculia bacterium]|nr:efflux RND transporter periplasmic adaptor subunit [Thermoanaerobaculia bacterium]